MENVDLKHLCYLASVILVMEILAIFFFAMLGKLIYGSYQPSGGRLRAVFKGLLERLTILWGLMMGFPQILIAFGTIRLGTRFFSQAPDQDSNDFFLMGTFVSLLLTFSYYQYWIWLTTK